MMSVYWHESFSRALQAGVVASLYTLAELPFGMLRSRCAIAHTGVCRERVARASVHRHQRFLDVGGGGPP